MSRARSQESLAASRIREQGMNGVEQSEWRKLKRDLNNDEMLDVRDIVGEGFLHLIFPYASNREVFRNSR